MADRGADTVVDMLSKVDLFDGMSRKELALVRDVSREHSYPEGAVIVEEGATDRRFFLLLDGRVDVTVGGTLVRVFGPGGTFGEISVLDGGPRTATITATSPVTALSIAYFNLRSLLKENPSMAVKLIEVLAGKVRSLTGAGVG
jgi:CRP/FNR family transcriptional regulator, cyclic AMP receptor protein